MTPRSSWVCARAGGITAATKLQVEPEEDKRTASVYTTVYNCHCQPLVWLEVEEVLAHWWCRYQVASRARRGQENQFSYTTVYICQPLEVEEDYWWCHFFFFSYLFHLILFQLFHFIHSSSTSPYVIMIIIMTCPQCEHQTCTSCSCTSVFKKNTN